MAYRYPSAQLLSFGSLIAAILIFSVLAVGFVLSAFGWAHWIVGSALSILLCDIPVIAAAVACWLALRHYYPRKRPIEIDQDAIAALGLWGKPRIEMRWDDVTRIKRELLYDPVSYRNAWCYDVVDSGNQTISFDDTINEYQSLVAELNRQIMAHNIVANSIMRGPDALMGVTDPGERYRLIKSGRLSKVTSFDEQLGADQ